MVRCFKIGFLPVAFTRLSRSSAVLCFGGGTGSAAVCRGPYSQVTSESFSLESGDSKKVKRGGGEKKKQSTRVSEKQRGGNL